MAMFMHVVMLRGDEPGSETKHKEQAPGPVNSQVVDLTATQKRP